MPYPTWVRAKALPALAALLLIGASSAVKAVAIPTEFVTACETRLPPTTVEIKTESTPITYLLDRSVGALTAQHPPGGDFKTLGLTERAFRSQMEVQGPTLTLANPAIICTRPAVTVTLSLVPHVVAIGREFPTDSCAYKVIAEHESRHVLANNLALTRTAAAMEKALKDSFSNRVFYGESAWLEAALQEHVQAWLDWAESELKKVDALHADIDTPEEYARSEHICGGEIPRILRANGY